MSGVGTCASDVICGPPLRAASLAPDAVGADALLPFPLPVQPAPSEMAQAQLRRARATIALKPRTRVRESAISTRLRERVRGFETRTAEIIERGMLAAHMSEGNGNARTRPQARAILHGQRLDDARPQDS